MSVAIDYETASACPLCKYLKVTYQWIAPKEWERLHFVNYSPSTLTVTSSVRAAVKEFLGLVKEKDSATQIALEKWGITPTLIERHRPVKVTTIQKVAWRTLRATAIAQHVARTIAGIHGRSSYWWNRFTQLVDTGKNIESDHYVYVCLKRDVQSRMRALDLKGKEITELSVSLVVAQLKELHNNERARRERAAVEGGVEEATD